MKRDDFKNYAGGRCATSPRGSRRLKGGVGGVEARAPGPKSAHKGSERIGHHAILSLQTDYDEHLSMVFYHKMNMSCFNS